MDIFLLEQESRKLRDTIAVSASRTERLFAVIRFYRIICQSSSLTGLMPFVEEHFQIFKDSFLTYTALSKHPDLTTSLLSDIDRLRKCALFSGYDKFLTENYERITSALSDLNLILEGGKTARNGKNKIHFPVLEESIQGTERFGLLESLTIKISKSKFQDELIFVPGGTGIEEKISAQTKASLSIALEYIRKYVRKVSRHHEIIVSFDRKLGTYEGNSLGIALTIGLIEEFLRIYNAPVTVNLFPEIAVTGSVDEDGSVSNLDNSIVRDKLIASFFSPASVLIVPEANKHIAQNELDSLTAEFPARNFKVIGVDDFEDLINRRNIIEIKKKPVAKRAAVFLLRNWLNAAAVLVLTAIISFFAFVDLDDNPSYFTADGGYIYFKNKNGKILFRRPCVFSSKDRIEQVMINERFRIIDINGDRNNEIIDCYGNNGQELLSCRDKNNQLLWQFRFTDTAYSKRETLYRPYGIKIVDTVTISGKKELIIAANNVKSFASAILVINPKTGERVDGTYWVSGHILDSRTDDVNHDGIKEVLILGTDNGFEDAALSVISLDSLNGVRPSTSDYNITNEPLKAGLFYLRIPKTDYDIFTEVRSPPINWGALSLHDNSIYFGTSFLAQIDNKSEMRGGIVFIIGYNLNKIELYVHSGFRIIRDSLVAQGKLHPPYTDTREYIEAYKRSLKVYDNGVWRNWGE